MSGKRLHKRQVKSGDRHFSLGGKPVHDGDQLEAFMYGEWVLITFQSPAADDKSHGILPGGEVAVALNDDAKLRWPK
jgi:hypothetical protein